MRSNFTVYFSSVPSMIRTGRMYLAYIFLITVASSSTTPNNQVAIVSVLQKYFGVDSVQLIQTENKKNHLDLLRKLIFEASIYSSVLSLDDCYKFLKNEQARPNGEQLMVMFVYTPNQLQQYCTALAKISQEQLITPMIWVMFANLQNTTKSTFFNNIYLPFNCRFLVVEQSNLPKQRPTAQIYEVYKISSKSPLITEYFGSWTENGLRSPEKHIYSRRKNLAGQTLNLAFSGDNHQCDKYEDGAQTTECLHWDFMTTLTKTINYTMSVLPFRAGRMHMNGTSSGTFKQVQAGEVDISPENFVVSSQRLPFFDFVWPTSVESTLLYYKSEHSEAIVWSAYFQPFSKQVWLVILLWIPVCGFLIFLTIYFAGHKAKLDLNSLSFIDALVIPFCSLCFQAGRTRHKNWSFRTAYLAAYLAGIVMYPAYSAAVIAYITVSRPGVQLTGLTDLIADRSYKLLVVKDSYESFYFTNDNSEESQIIRNDFLLPENQFPETEAEGMNAVCSERIAFLAYEPDMMRVKNYTCRVSRSNRNVFQYTSGIILKKNSPYTDLLNLYLRRMRYSGAIQRMRLKPRDFPHEEASKFISVEFKNITPLLLIYALLIVVSIIVLLFELANYSHHREQQARDNRQLLFYKERQQYQLNLMTEMKMQIQRPIAKQFQV